MFKFKPQGMTEEEYSRVMSRKSGMGRQIPQGMDKAQYSRVMERKGLAAQDAKSMRLAAEKKNLSSQNAGTKIQLASMAAQEIANSQSNDQGYGDTNTGSSAMSGVAQGAAMGASIGGVQGAVIGGAIGGVKGVLGARSARKRQRADAAAQHYDEIGRIEQEKTLRLQNAFQSLSNAFNASLLR